jgi:hypothetical protein
MLYLEVYQDLFSVSDDYFLCQCISADFTMGLGIAVEFNNRFDTRNTLKSKYPHYMIDWKLGGYSGDCILENRVLNLVTKERYYDKPTLGSLRSALVVMKKICEEEDICKIAMPLIGCGLDRLHWKDVSALVQEVFNDMDIQVLVCIK